MRAPWTASRSNQSILKEISPEYSLEGLRLKLELLHLVKAMVFPVVMYGCESWTMKKAERQRIDAFELWCWRRLLKSPLDCKDARYWMLGAGALGRPRGMVWGGRREEGSGWGAYVYLWRIHLDTWQN